MDNIKQNKIDLLSFEDISFNKAEISLNNFDDAHFLTKKIVLVMQVREIFNYFKDIEVIELAIIPNNLELIKQLYPLPIELKETEFCINLNLYLDSKVVYEKVNENTDKTLNKIISQPILFPINKTDIQINNLNASTSPPSLVKNKQEKHFELIEWNAQTISSIAGDIKENPISIFDKYNHIYSKKRFQDEIEAQLNALKNYSFLHFLYHDSNCYASHYTFSWRRSFLVSDIEKFLGIAGYTFYEKSMINKNLNVNNNSSQLDLSIISSKNLVPHITNNYTFNPPTQKANHQKKSITNHKVIKI